MALFNSLQIRYNFSVIQFLSTKADIYLKTFNPVRRSSGKDRKNMKRLLLTAAIEKEKLSTGEDIYVALCLELDIASQGFSVEEAKANLIEAVELFLETASPSELERRLPNRGVGSE